MPDALRCVALPYALHCIALGTQLLPNTTVAYPICRSVCLSVRKVYYGKTVDSIRMPFRVVSARGMGVLDEGVDRRKGRGSFGTEFGASLSNQW